MSNMSYCRFENTAADVQDCNEAIGEAIDNDVSKKEFVLSLSSEQERSAFERMYEQCKNFVEAYETMKEGDGE